MGWDSAFGPGYAIPEPFGAFGRLGHLIAVRCTGGLFIRACYLVLRGRAWKVRAGLFERTGTLIRDVGERAWAYSSGG
jgi:hypothetical protein